MLGAKVTATATYCGHTLQADTNVNDLEQWIGDASWTAPTSKGRRSEAGVFTVLLRERLENSVNFFRCSPCPSKY